MCISTQSVLQSLCAGELVHFGMNQSHQIKKPMALGKYYVQNTKENKQIIV